MNFGGPLDLVSKTNMKEVCFDEEEGDGEEVLIMSSNDEHVVYYSNNSVKKFNKKPIKSNFKNSSFKKTSSTSKSGVLHKGDEKLGEKKE